MMNGYPIRKAATICGIHRNTAFVWRHKILDALQNMANSVELNGIIEADETFFTISFKRNHSKIKTFTMPRKPHKRGNSTCLRGLSREKVCVPCAVNRNGKTTKGIYNIQHINNYHGQLKKFIRGLNGVSTKYLNNYLVWNNFINYAKETDAEKRNIFMTFVFTTLKSERCKEISNRPAVPLVA